jgi:multicomponent K+:H+ antiporter subunit A
MPYDTASLAILCLPFAASMVAPWLRGRRAATGLMLAAAAIGLLLSAALQPALAGGTVLRSVLPWVPSLGLELVLRVDGFSWLFLMLVCGIGLLVGVYARYYMPPDDPLSRFYALLLAFMGSMLGVVMSGNVIQLVFFWELTSLFSFLLIGYWNQGASAREGARMALIVTGGGGLCLFAGMMLLGRIAGSYDLDVILAAG